MLRDELRNEIGALRAQRGEVLHAVLESPHKRGEIVDVENVLLYNLGAGSLAQACANGLRFERRFEVPAEGVPRGAKHGYSYELAEVADSFVNWREISELARFDWIEMPTWSDLRTPVSELWWRIRHSDQVHVTAANSNPMTFALWLEIAASAGSAAPLLKKAVDAVVAAFQSQAATSQTALDVLATQLGEPADVVEGTLRAAERAVLGPAPTLVVPRASSVQWNPGDHGLVAGEFLLAAPLTAAWLMRGRLATVEPA